MLDTFKKWNDPVILGDMTTVSHRLRQSDIDEIHADDPDADPYDVIEKSVKGSQLRFAIVNREHYRKPIGLWGIGAKLIKPHGYFPIWLLGTDELTEAGHAREFVKLTRLFMPHLHSVYGALGNWIYEGNETTLKWIHHLGFRRTGRTCEAFRTKKKFIEVIYW